MNKKQSQNSEAVNSLAEILKKSKNAFIHAGLFSMFINILMLLPSIYMLLVYDKVMVSRSLDTLLLLTILVTGLFFVLGTLQMIRSRILVRVGNKIDLDMNTKLFDTIFETARLKPGQVTSAPMSDLTKLRQYLTGQGVFALFDVPWFPFYLFVMYLFSPFLAGFTVFAAFVIVIITIINERSTKKDLEEANKLSNKANFYINKNIQNAEIIHAMGMQQDIKKRWHKQHIKFLHTQSRASDHAGKWSNLSKTLRQLFQSLTYGIGAYLAIMGDISGGTIIAGAVLLGRALAPLDLLIGSWKGFADAKSAYKRLDALLKEYQEKKETTELPAPKGHIATENIIVVPPMAKLPVLKGINIDIPQGITVGIIGASGSGKTTFAKAILGVWPIASGVARLDGADIHQWDSQKLGKYIGYLPQDIELFEGTIAENIARLGEVDDQKVVAAAQMAGVHEMILKLPNGYDTQIGTGGIGLSGGQKQRIALARAVYNNPVLVVLDEPNSNLDAEGEIALNNTILHLKSIGSTVLVISHKMDILKVTDRVALFGGGTLQMYGPTKDVLTKLNEQAAAQAQAQKTNAQQAQAKTQQTAQSQVTPKVSLSKPEK